jgi:CheY-like chemotaxis protein
MGGEIGAHPRSSGGSVFWFTASLPRVAGGAEPHRSSGDLAGSRALVVDDNATSRTILEHYLTAWGLACETTEQPWAAIEMLEHAVLVQAMLAKRGLRSDVAHNGREAVEMAATNDYAAVLMDCQMPEIDGYQATQLIRAAEPDGSHIPIIALTAHTMRGDRERCLASGMDDYLSKPLQSANMDLVLRRWIRQDVQSPQPSSCEAAHVSTDDAVTPIPEALNHVTIAQLRDDLPVEVRQHLIDTFEGSLPDRVAAIRAAARHPDTTELRRAAHLLKGSSLSLGASRLAYACHQIEHAGAAQGSAVTEEHIAFLVTAADEARQSLRDQLL